MRAWWCDQSCTQLPPPLPQQALFRFLGFDARLCRAIVKRGGSGSGRQPLVCDWDCAPLAGLVVVPVARCRSGRVAQCEEGEASAGNLWMQLMHHLWPSLSPNSLSCGSRHSHHPSKAVNPSFFFILRTLPTGAVGRSLPPASSQMACTFVCRLAFG